MKTIFHAINVFFIWLFKGKKPMKKATDIYPAYEITQFDLDIISLINRYRFDNKIWLVSYSDKKLFDVAYSHCKYMRAQQKPSHDYFQKRADQFPNQNLSEIIAYNFQTPESIVKAWLSSPKHKEVIDKKEYKSIAVAKAVDENGKNYVTALFLSDN